MTADKTEGETIPWESVLAKAVHDMRTPLSSMRTSLEVLRMVAGDPEKSERLLMLMNKQVDEMAGHLDTLARNPRSFAG